MARIQDSKIHRFMAGMAVVCLWLAVANASAAEPPWLEIHSTHFTVITDAGTKRGQEVALRFEQMRSVFAILLSKDRLNQPLPLTILALKSDKMYYQTAPLVQGQPIAVPGFFVPGEDQNFIVLNLFEEEPWRAVSREFCHMLLNANYPPAQGWFDEGLCEYFSSLRLDDRNVQIGGDPELQPSVKQDLLQNQVAAHPAKSLTELLGAQVWIALPDLFAMKHEAATGSAGSDNARHTLYYAQSWMVMHYLLHEKKLDETGTYFDLALNQHLPVEEAIQKAYGISAAQLEKAVKDYFHAQTGLLTALDAARGSDPNAAQQVAQGYLYPAPVGPESSVITAKALPEADAEALRAGIEVRIPDRREAGLKELQALATTPAPVAPPTKSPVKKLEKKIGEIANKGDEAGAGTGSGTKSSDDPDTLETTSTTIGNGTAHRFLAWDHIEHGEFDAAVIELGDTAELNQRDMWIRYYLSVLKYRAAQAKHADIQGLANMMQDLRAVLEWFPEFANAYDLMAMARMEGGGAVSAMQAERAAMQLSPRDEVYVYHLAEIYISAKKWEAAQALLDRLKTSGNAQIAALSKEKITQIGSERKYGIIGASAGQTQFATQKSPFDVLEQDAAARAAAEKAAQDSGPADKRVTKFFKGRLVAVDCSAAPVAVLTVTSEGVVLKLRTVDYRSLLLVGADIFSCDWKNRPVTVNYKPGGLTDGDLVSLEVR
jgi:tetratricopeptide (TPR) repeat protein